MNTPIVILAAGASRRLGQAKQLLAFKDSNLLGHTINVCLESGVGEVHVILGAYYKGIYKEIEHFPVQVHEFENWSVGMGASIAFATQLFKDTKVDGLIFCVGDQVHLEASILKNIQKEIKEKSALIIRSQYQKGFGPPTYFDKRFFSELMDLNGEEGAKTLIKKHIEKVSTLDFPLGMIDVDTPEDLEHLGNL